jgi:ABC-type phosphate/phosphonate transport system substrate-binding protein
MQRGKGSIEMNCKASHKVVLQNLLCLIAFLCLLFPADAAEVDLKHTSLNIGYTSKAFVSLPKDDVRVAVQVMTDKIARKTVGAARSKVYNFTEEIEKDIKQSKLDIVALAVEEYLMLRPLGLLEPSMLTVNGKSHEVGLLLLVRKESPAHGFRDLKGRTMVLPSVNTQAGSTLHSWLELLVMRQGKAVKEDYFSVVTETRNASQAIMSVFFRKAEACVVTVQSYETAIELNPQIGRELRVIGQIQGLAGGMIAIRKGLPEKLKHTINAVLKTLHEDTDGKQMFTMFQLNRLAPYRHEYLKHTEAMYAEHRKLKSQVRR